jgi:nickel/cobalt transporter (NicO) family protein
VSQHEVALGLLLIVAFSLGLALTLTALGMTVLLAGRFSSRLTFSSRPAAIVPTLSAVVIVAAGCLLTIRAIPGVL